MQNEEFLSVKSVKSLSAVALAKADVVQFLWSRPAGLCNLGQKIAKER